jgi:uncharacterized membrane protein YhaH (DUF805 family)
MLALVRPGKREGSRMRGVVTGIVPDGSYGQIKSDDGQTYSYWSSEVRNGPVQVGQAVEFQMWEGQPVDIHILDNVPTPTGAPRQGFAAGGAAGSAVASLADAFPSSKDYWIKLFTSPSGRISRRQFWLHGILPIVACNILLTWIPLIGQLIGLVLLWASICIGFKRFHDHGYPGWYSLASLVPVMLGTLFFVIGLASDSAVATVLGEICWGIGALVGLAQFIFIYLRIGQPGPNQYGPDPLAV